MPVRVEQRSGKRRLVIDIGYHRKDGSWAQYRRDSTAPTLSAAREEERRIRDRIARTGSPVEEMPEPVEPERLVTYEDLVAEYRRDFMATALKVTTRRGYDAVLDHHLLPTFGVIAVHEITARMVDEFDVALAKERGRTRKTKARTTRNNVQIVLRSTLRFARERGYLDGMPTGLPRLKRPEKTILEIPTDEDVAAILAEAVETQRRAFTLMACAGLRPNEVRGLLWRDVRFPDGDKLGVLCVREGVSFKERHSPKTGQREVPITPFLARELTSTLQRPRESPVALTAQGKPWGDTGLSQAFKRVIERIGHSSWTVYYLRHYAITSWLRRGVPVHVVQRMAGHTNLSTTQGYVHYLKGDLSMAARLIGNILETAPARDGEPPAVSP